MPDGANVLMATMNRFCPGPADVASVDSKLGDGGRLISVCDGGVLVYLGRPFAVINTLERTARRLRPARGNYDKVLRNPNPDLAFVVGAQQ